MNEKLRAEFWLYVNRYVMACGGNPNDRHSSVGKHVAEVELSEVLRKIVDDCKRKGSETP